MRYVYLVFFVVFAACSLQEEDISTSSSLFLTVSTDTVLFDTLLTTRTSVTKRLRIYNQNENAVKVSSIRLGKGTASRYNMIVNGQSGISINDQVIFGRDSLLILVDVLIDPLDQTLPFLVKDSILFDWNGNTAHVKLVAWGQDAVFLNEAILLTQTWSNEKPYVIQDFALVDTSETLTIEPGTKIYLDNEASLFVAGSLNIQGDTANPVILRNTRFDENYLEAPGQWGGVFFLEGSSNSTINHAVIENGTFGIRAGIPDEDEETDIFITNTTIRHMLSSGILAFTTDIDAYNVEVFNCGTYLVGNFAGGTYRYRHCTFSNQPSFFITDDPMVQFSDNIVLEDDQLLVSDLTIEIENSIIWAGGNEQLVINNGGGARVTSTLQNNIIRSVNNIEGNFTSTEPNFPGFNDPNFFDYSLDSLAFARNKATLSEIPFDIAGNLRGPEPDIGAHEFIPN